jgi:hypothetical protein
LDSGFCPRILLCSDFSYIQVLIPFLARSESDRFRARSHTIPRTPHSAGRIRTQATPPCRRTLTHSPAFRIPQAAFAFQVRWPCEHPSDGPSHSGFRIRMPHSGRMRRILVSQAAFSRRIPPYTPHSAPAFRIPAPAFRIPPPRIPHSALAFRMPPPHSAASPRILQPALAFCSLPHKYACCPPRIPRRLQAAFAGRIPLCPPTRCAPSPAAAGRIPQPHSGFRIFGRVKVEPDSGSALVIL